MHYAVQILIRFSVGILTTLKKSQILQILKTLPNSAKFCQILQILKTLANKAGRDQPPSLQGTFLVINGEKSDCDETAAATETSQAQWAVLVLWVPMPIPMTD